MRRTTLVAGTVAAAAAVVALTACGPSNNASGSPQANSGSQNSSQGNTGSVGDSVNTVTDLANVVGNQTTSSKSAHFSIAETGTADINGTGQAQFGNPVAMSMSMQIPQMGQMKVVLLNNAFYMSLPMLQQEVGKPWVKIDASGTDPASQAFGQIIQMADQNSDPAKQLQLLEKSSTINSKSSDTVDGQATTKYQITVDVSKLVNNLPGTSTQLKSLMSQAEQSGLKTYPVTLWLNDQKLPVKMNTDIKMTMQGKSIDENVTTTYTQWGQPVTITAPPADQIGSMPTS